MTNIVDLDEIRNKPDADCVWADEGGVKWFKFSAEFFHDGKNWGFFIWARDFTDAESRIQSIKATVALGGQIFSEIEA